MNRPRESGPRGKKRPPAAPARADEPPPPAVVDSEFVRLEQVAAELQMFATRAGRRRPDTLKLLTLSRAGKFPPVLRVTRKHLLVRRDDFANWKAGRWTSTEDVRGAMVQDAAVGRVVPNRRRKGTGGEQK
jgi:hypothetical protein